MDAGRFVETEEPKSERQKRRRRPPASEIGPATPIWCPGCKSLLTAADFNIERRRFSGLKTRCRTCEAAARRTPDGRERTRRRNQSRWTNPGYREKSLAAAKARRRERGQADLRRARARLRAIVDEWKAQACADCGYDDIRAIDPDHLDGILKVGHISRMVQLCASAARIREELGKCVPRCARCHRRITQGQRPSAWRSIDRLPPSWRRRLDFQDRNDQIKLSRGCADCGWRGWPRGLDWDHVRGPKVSTIATMIANGRPWVEVAAEMRKCDVVCANCHRIRTVMRLAKLGRPERTATGPDDDVS